MYNTKKASSARSSKGYGSKIRGGVLCETNAGMKTVQGGTMTSGNKSKGSQVRGGQLA